MTYFPLPPGVTSTPLEGVTNSPSYKSPTSDAPPPAYFPPSHSSSPRPPVYTSPGRPNHDANSHWARFPSTPPRPSTHKPLPSSQTPSEIEARRTRLPSRAPPGYIAGKLNPAPKKHRHRSSMRPDLRAKDGTDARYPASQPPPFSYSPDHSRSPSPCPPTHSTPSRIPLNVGVETELDTHEERRQQYIPGAKNRYNMLADESDLLIEGRERYGGWGSYGVWGERYGNGRCGSPYRRGAAVAWCVAALVLVAVTVAVVVRVRANGN